jgi:hypothetical protein
MFWLTLAATWLLVSLSGLNVLFMMGEALVLSLRTLESGPFATYIELISELCESVTDLNTYE